MASGTAQDDAGGGRGALRGLHQQPLRIRAGRGKSHPAYGDASGGELSGAAVRSLREKDREPDCTQAASACLLQCIEAMSGVLRRGATQPELKQCAAECIGWLESILRTDRADGGQENEDKAGKGSLEEG